MYIVFKQTGLAIFIVKFGPFLDNALHSPGVTIIHSDSNSFNLGTNNSLFPNLIERLKLSVFGNDYLCNS